MATSAMRGCDAMPAMTTAPTRSRTGDRRQPTSIALTLRNRIVLTIRNPGTSTIGSASAAMRGSWSPHGYQNTVEAVTDAAAGLGKPAKYRLSVTAIPWMLKRASRMAAAVR